MPKVKEMTIDDIEHLIEHKLLELIGDPDSGLQLNEEFKKKLEKRLKNTSKSTSHQEILKKFG